MGHYFLDIQYVASIISSVYGGKNYNMNILDLTPGSVVLVET